MFFNFSSKRRLILLFSFLLIILFQNCGPTGAPKDDATLSSMNSGCVDNLCSGDPSENLRISVENSDPVRVRANSATTATTPNLVDIAGFCDAAGYSQTVMYYQLRLKAGGSLVGKTRVTSQCSKLGRFQVSVPITTPTTANQQFVATITMMGWDEDNAIEVANPIGSNVKDVNIRIE